MQLMGLTAIYPKKRRGLSDGPGRRFPYLLQDVDITVPDQVWATDITYIPLIHGFMYLMAIMDWMSRYVISWRLSNTLDALFCIEALQEALSVRKPEYFNSDQGSQFVDEDFILPLEEAGVKISQTGKGRVFDNIFVERLWRSVKYEEVYLNEYETGGQAQTQLAAYFHFYNNQRPHQCLGYRTPRLVYEDRSLRQERSTP